MGSQDLYCMVRFRGRYYVTIYQHLHTSDWGDFAADIIRDIPTDTNKYQKWLKSMRAKYAAKEKALERHVYEIRDGVEPKYSQFGGFVMLPTEFPPLGRDVGYIFIVNLDREVLTMDLGVHWNLRNIPRQDDLWIRAITRSIYAKPTISLDMCPEEHMASPAVAIPEWDRKLDYDNRKVTARTDLAEARKAFLTHMLANIFIQYKDKIIGYGMEWTPDSFPFRELVFALVSIASGQAKFHSFPAQQCNPRTCERGSCNSKHIRKSHGWLGQKWVGDSAPLLEFGSPCHRPGEPPGASPVETIYWLEDVLVSLVLVTDGAAITKAVTWGIEQGRANFQVVVLSLFQAAFAEVTSGPTAKPLVKFSPIFNLSPLRARYCTSTHPRTRPQFKRGMQIHHNSGERIMRNNCTGTRRRLQRVFPGLAALVNFFEVAANRRAASKSEGIFPAELYERILDFVDYDTWKACLLVSTDVRSLCLRKYRLDDRTRIVAGPFVRVRERWPMRHVSFNFENLQTGEILPMMRASHPDRWTEKTEEYNWMPVIGSDRKALMLAVFIQFEPAGDVPVESDRDEERA